MTELIVALDGPEPLRLLRELRDRAGVKWFKLGEQAIVDQDWPMLLWERGCSIFVDLKFPGTADSVREAVRRLDDIGVSAVSTYHPAATRAALSAGGDIAVWQVLVLTDDFGAREWVHQFGVGMICPGDAAPAYRHLVVPLVVPGVRLTEQDDFHGHTRGTTCGDIAGLADYAVVGRPIWQSPDPVVAARNFMWELGKG